MTTLAKIGWGAKFALHNGTALTDLAEVTGIGVPEDQVDTVEATHFGSDQARREYIAGLVESGEGEFEINYVPGSATDTLCRTALASRAQKAYKITLPTTSGTWEITGTCVVVGFQRSIPIDDRMTATLRVKFSGAATEAAGV